MVAEMDSPRTGIDRSASRAVGLMALAALAVPAINAIVKELSQDYPVPMLLWSRYAGHLLFTMLVFLPLQGSMLFRARRPGLQVCRSLLFCATSLFVFLGLGHLPLTSSSALQFTAPLIVTALAPFLLRERLTVLRAFGVVAGFSGALIVVRPGLEGDILPVLSILLSAFCAAFVQILSRKLGGWDTPATSNFYMVFFGLLASSALLPWYWVMPHSSMDLLLFAMLGILGGFGHYCMLRAFELAPASFISPFSYLQIIGSAGLGFLFFGDVMDELGWAGASLIVCSGVTVLIFDGRRKSA